MAIKIKKHLFGGWSYQDKIGRGIIYSNQEMPAVNLSEVQDLTAVEVDKLHIKMAGQKKLDAMIDSKISEFFNKPAPFDEHDFVIMLEDSLSSKIFVKEHTGQEKYKSVEDFMQPDELARYLSTLICKIKAQFEEKIKNAPNYHVRFSIEKVLPRFMKITEAQMVVFEKTLFENQMNALIQIKKGLLAEHGDKSETNAELEAEIKKLEGELARLKPEVDKAEKILFAALGKSHSEMRQRATKHTQGVADIEAKIAEYKQKIEKLDASNEEQAKLISLYKNEVLKLENELARLKAQAKGFSAAGYTPDPPAGPTP